MPQGLKNPLSQGLPAFLTILLKTPYIQWLHFSGTPPSGCLWYLACHIIQYDGGISSGSAGLLGLDNHSLVGNIDNQLSLGREPMGQKVTKSY